MSAYTVRQALLADAGGISQVYQSQMDVSAPETFSLYERWNWVGGPWMAVETCAVWLAHLLRASDGIPLVAEAKGRIWGYAEVFLGHEAEPYGHHLNIGRLAVHRETDDPELGAALVAYAEQLAWASGCRQVTVAYPTPPTFWEGLGYQPLVTRYALRLNAEEGRVFYKARDLPSDEVGQIRGWAMPLGRYQNAREEWERMAWALWTSVPSLVEAKWHRLFIDLTGQPAILHLHQHDEDASTATARLWTKFALTTHLVSAVRDRAARLGYTHLTTLVDGAARPLLTEASMEGGEQVLMAKRR